MVDIQKVCDVEIDGIDHRDAPDYCDAYIAAAWLDEGDGKFRPLTDDELDWLNDTQRDFVYEQVNKWIY
jgi:hypothetical protein